MLRLAVLDILEVESRVADHIPLLSVGILGLRLVPWHVDVGE